MDWAKAKTILIAVFLTINIFLTYMIIGANTASIGYVDSEKVQLVESYLAEKGVTVKGKVPLRKLHMPSITVKYKLFNKEDIKKRIFSSDKNPVESTVGNIHKLVYGSTEVSIKDNRELTYSNSSIKPAAVIDEKVSTKKIKEFISSLGLKDNADIRVVEDLEGYKRFIYGQSFKGEPIYNSVMEFYANDAGVQRARIVWLETVKQAGRKTEVISPVLALLSLPESNKENITSSKEVLEIEQGYYFGTGASGQVDVSKVEEGTAFPVWKITADRDTIYINAYNEKIEGVEKARN